MMSVDRIVHRPVRVRRKDFLTTRPRDSWSEWEVVDNDGRVLVRDKNNLIIHLIAEIINKEPLVNASSGLVVE